jgi:hypothetical protein
MILNSILVYLLVLSILLLLEGYNSEEKGEKQVIISNKKFYLLVHGLRQPNYSFMAKARVNHLGQGQ